MAKWRNDDPRALETLLSLSKALNDAARVRVLAALRGGELCLCQIVELLGLAPSTLSKHLNQLTAAGLVVRRKEGRWTYFRLAGRGAPAQVRRALDWALGSLCGDAVVRDDARRLGTIRTLDPEEMTACYRS